jgi:outer membrane protein assembly factor BamB
MSTQLLSRLEGQEALVSYVAPPTRDYHYVLTGDINGSIRAWGLPSRWSRTLLRVPSPLYTVAFVDGREIAVAGSDGIVRMINIDTGSVRELASHHSIISKVQTSPDSKYLSSLGRDEGVRVWSVSTGKIARIFDKHDGTVQDIDYLEHGKLVVSAGDDGRLFAWNPGALNATLLLSRPRPLVTLEVLSKKQTVIVEDAAGSIWEVTLGGITSQIRTEKPTWSRLRSSPSGAFLATGSDDGEVIVYNTDNWTIVARTVVGGRVGQLQFDPKDRDLLIASEGGGIRLLNLDGRRSLSWTDIPLAARDIAYSPDGEMIAILCMDGAEWFYAIRNSTWVYTHAHEADVRTGRFSSDGNLFVSIDIRGSIIVHDLTIALSSAH